MEREIFKLEIEITTPILRTITKRFVTLKSMRQWQKRTNLDHALWCLCYREYVFVNEDWERFTVIGKRIVTLSELERIVEKLHK
jgi:hypothetical protein